MSTTNQKVLERIRIKITALVTKLRFCKLHKYIGLNLKIMLNGECYKFNHIFV